MAAALELRYGIEARLDDYLRATLKQLGREDSPIAEFRASKLLKLLVKANPRAKGRSSVRFSNTASGSVSGFEYTPVTAELAKLHGTLGELLHYKFFATRKAWMVKQRSQGRSIETALDARDLVERGQNLLAEACRGTLLANAGFTSQVSKILESGQ
jgi:hypothetical protein